MGKNDVTWGQANSIALVPNQKVNKAEELTDLSTNSGFWSVVLRRGMQSTNNPIRSQVQILPLLLRDGTGREKSFFRHF